MILRDASLGTIAHGVFLLYVAPLPTLRHRDLVVDNAFATKFLRSVLQHMLPGRGSVHTSMVCTHLWVWTRDPW